jgi:hypothetical protein
MAGSTDAAGAHLLAVVDVAEPRPGEGAEVGLDDQLLNLMAHLRRIRVSVKSVDKIGILRKGALP